MNSNNFTVRFNDIELHNEMKNYSLNLVCHQLQLVFENICKINRPLNERNLCMFCPLKIEKQRHFFDTKLSPGSAGNLAFL